MQVETSITRRFSEYLRAVRPLSEGRNEAVDYFPAHETIFMMPLIVHEEAGSEIRFSERRRKCLNKYGDATLKV